MFAVIIVIIWNILPLISGFWNILPLIRHYIHILYVHLHIITSNCIGYFHFYNDVPIVYVYIISVTFII